jgi:hypothetical protein
VSVSGSSIGTVGGAQFEVGVEDALVGHPDLHGLRRRIQPVGVACPSGPLSSSERGAIAPCTRSPDQITAEAVRSTVPTFPAGPDVGRDLVRVGGNDPGPVDGTDHQVRARGVSGPASTRRLPRPNSYCSDSYLNETRNFVR